ncbi:MAG: hypothetical protein EOO59_04765 [Hymenobacter sp.]|nr:MAG: hypothetical protein EOO59_04765 [Hymenobacter sp.]
MAERSQLAQLRALSTRYHLLENGHLDGASGRPPPTAPGAGAAGLALRVFYCAPGPGALAAAVRRLADPAHSLRRQAPWRQQQWLQDRPFALSGFEYLAAYEVQAALNETPDSRSASFSARDNPAYYALDQGRY